MHSHSRSHPSGGSCCRSRCSSCPRHRARGRPSFGSIASLRCELAEEQEMSKICQRYEQRWKLFVVFAGQKKHRSHIYAFAWRKARREREGQDTGHLQYVEVHPQLRSISPQNRVRSWYGLVWYGCYICCGMNTTTVHATIDSILYIYMCWLKASPQCRSSQQEVSSASPEELYLRW